MTTYPHSRFTSNKGVNGTAVYAIITKWPKYNVLTLGAPITGPNTVIEMLGYSKPFKFYKGLNNTVEIVFPSIPITQMPSLDAWVLKMTSLENQHVLNHHNTGTKPFLKSIDMLDTL